MSQPIEIYVKTLTGKTFSIDCEASNTVLQLKKIIEEKEIISINQQRLMFNNQELANYLLLIDYDIKNESTLFY